MCVCVFAVVGRGCRRRLVFGKRTRRREARTRLECEFAIIERDVIGDGDATGAEDRGIDYSRVDEQPPVGRALRVFGV